MEATAGNTPGYSLSTHKNSSVQSRFMVRPRSSFMSKSSSSKRNASQLKCCCNASNQVFVLQKRLHDQILKNQLLESRLAATNRISTFVEAAKLSALGIYHWSSGDTKKANSCFELAQACSCDDVASLVCQWALFQINPELAPVISADLITVQLRKRAEEAPKVAKEACVRYFMNELKLCKKQHKQCLQAVLGMIYAVCNINHAAARHHLLRAAQVSLWSEEDQESKANTLNSGYSNPSKIQELLGVQSNLKRNKKFGSILALHCLADAACHGLFGFPRCKGKACELALRAALLGDAASQFLLGSLASQGVLGTVQKDEYAFVWYRLAAARLLPRALIALGNCHAAGRGTFLDLQQAVSCFRLAAQRGHPTAAYNLAMCYMHGHGVSFCARKALKWLLRGAEAGHAPSQYELGVAYADGVLGQSKQQSKGMVWLKKAGEQGHLKALSYLAALLLKSKDPKRQVEGNKYLEQLKEYSNKEQQCKDVL